MLKWEYFLILDKEYPKSEILEQLNENYTKIK